MKTKYPSGATIRQIFDYMETGEYSKFFAHVAEDVDWTVMGTHPLAGRYLSRAEFQQATFARLAGIMKEPGLRLKVRQVIGGGDEPWAVVELIAVGVCKNGLKFDNTYAWVVRFNEKGTIVQVRAYLDSWLVREAVVENECPSSRAPVE